MDKKAVAELKKLFTRKNCRIDWIHEAYIGEVQEDESRSIIHQETHSIVSISEDDLLKYMDLLKASISGKFGKNLNNMSFNNEEENNGHKILCDLYKASLKDDADALINELVERIIKYYYEPGKYVIMIGHGIYDVPEKSTDGKILEDQDRDTYHFLIVSLCPVKLAKLGLCYHDDTDTFAPVDNIWSIQKPDTGFLFPSFNDRSTDIHEALFYSKKGEERHTEVAEQVLECSLPNSEQTDKNLFVSMIEESLGKECNFELIKNITDEISDKASESGFDDKPSEIGVNEIAHILKDNNVDDESIEKMKNLYKERLGNHTNMTAVNLADSSVKIVSNNVKMSVNNESAAFLESKVIDGREYILVPISDELTVNGIKIVQKLDN